MERAGASDMPGLAARAGASERGRASEFQSDQYEPSLGYGSARK